jgi:hypothetical protein
VKSIDLTQEFLFSAGFDSVAKQWNKEDGRFVQSFSVAAGAQVHALTASKDGLSLFTAATDHAAFVVQWSTLDATMVKNFEGFAVGQLFNFRTVSNGWYFTNRNWISI